MLTLIGNHIFQIQLSDLPTLTSRSLRFWVVDMYVIHIYCWEYINLDVTWEFWGRVFRCPLLLSWHVYSEAACICYLFHLCCFMYQCYATICMMCVMSWMLHSDTSVLHRAMEYGLKHKMASDKTKTSLRTHAMYMLYVFSGIEYCKIRSILVWFLFR